MNTRIVIWDSGEKEETDEAVCVDQEGLRWWRLYEVKDVDLKKRMMVMWKRPRQVEEGQEQGAVVADRVGRAQTFHLEIGTSDLFWAARGALYVTFYFFSYSDEPHPVIKVTQDHQYIIFATESSCATHSIQPNS